MHDVYDRAEEFVPERWLADDFKPSRGEFIAFGGGAHRCLGHVMATTELTVMLATLLQRGSYALEDRSVKAVGLTSMKPKGGVRIRLTV
ncbi:MAG TPA: cytochrome P450 [Tessaracoccus flavescens]|uniref:Cytochrome P450 n=1 Tax=Tessaracoccus flavescens TaxID=399497 RepID=A0A921JRJ8_9ACTN|nr:cytochrome P450 [Tessaracoccus flavescens]